MSGKDKRVGGVMLNDGSNAGANSLNPGAIVGENNASITTYVTLFSCAVVCCVGY